MLKLSQQQLNLVIGYPLSHSYSPRLHNIVYDVLHRRAVLKTFSNPVLHVAVEAMRQFSVGLTAVTMPFKETILSYLDHASPEVDILQAANTVIQREGKLIGYNTDVAGIDYALKNIRVDGKKILLIGAGGAAKAAGYYFKSQQSHVYWLNRTKERAANLAKLFGGVVVEAADLDHLDLDIIVNTTPIGMISHSAISPLPSFQWQPQHIVFDMVYNPTKTKLLHDAQQIGSTIISGIDMFIGQGIRQIELWQQQSLTSDELTESIRRFHNDQIH